MGEAAGVVFEHHEYSLLDEGELTGKEGRSLRST